MTTEREVIPREKAWGERYECNGPVATPSIFFDMTAEALP